MILECPSCHARYLVQIGLFAQGGRHVRCARCKHEWHAALPTSVDVFSPPPETPAPILPVAFPPPPPPPPVTPAPPRPPSAFASSPQTPIAAVTMGAAPAHVPNLPAVIKDRRWIKIVLYIIGGLLVAALGWAILDRQNIVKATPQLLGVYDFFGLNIPRVGDGLVFDHVESELRYDSGTMQLVVEGTVHNTTPKTQLVPDIKARALGADRQIIQSWWVAAPAATIEAGAEVPFRTQVSAPMKRTIENVYLEFYARDEESDAAH